MTFNLTIEAPPDFIFDILMAPEEMQKFDPTFKRVEYLSDSTRGLGAKYRVYHEFNGKQLEADYEIAECIQNELLRVIVRYKRTIRETEIRLLPTGNQTSVTLTSCVLAPKFIGAFREFLFRSATRRVQLGNWLKVKEYCEYQFHRSCEV